MARLGRDHTVMARTGRGSARCLRMFILSAGVGLMTCFLFVSGAFGADYELVAWDGSMPSDAVRAGEDDSGSALYACVASGWDGQHPGALSEDGTCMVAWGGQQHDLEDGFQVLVSTTSPDGEWVHLPDGGVPDNAFHAGGDDSGPLLVCRVGSWGGRYPGKLTEAGWCYVAHAGEEHYFTDDYEVLVE